MLVSFDGVRTRADSQYRLEMLEHIERGFRRGGLNGKRVLNPFRLWVLTPVRHEQRKFRNRRSNVIEFYD